MFYLLIFVIFLLCTVLYCTVLYCTVLYCREDFDVGGMLLCPAGQENLILGLRYGKAEAIGGRYGSLGK